MIYPSNLIKVNGITSETEDLKEMHCYYMNLCKELKFSVSWSTLCSC